MEIHDDSEALKNSKKHYPDKEQEPDDLSFWLLTSDFNPASALLPLTDQPGNLLRNEWFIIKGPCCHNKWQRKTVFLYTMEPLAYSLIEHSRIFDNTHS